MKETTRMIDHTLRKHRAQIAALQAQQSLLEAALDNVEALILSMELDEIQQREAGKSGVKEKE